MLTSADDESEPGVRGGVGEGDGPQTGALRGGRAEDGNARSALSEAEQGDRGTGGDVHAWAETDPAAGVLIGGADAGACAEAENPLAP
jgi:hypothetical protein